MAQFESAAMPYFFWAVDPRKLKFRMQISDQNFSFFCDSERLGVVQKCCSRILLIMLLEQLPTPREFRKCCQSMSRLADWKSCIKSITNQPHLHPHFTLKQGVVKFQLELEILHLDFPSCMMKFAWFEIFCFFQSVREAEWRSGSVLGP